MRKYIVQLFIVCVLLSIVGCGRKWNNPVDPQYGGCITGIVKDSVNMFVTGALVLTYPTMANTTTNSYGEFILSNMMPGTYKVITSKSGLYSTIVTAEVTSGDTSKLNIVLPIVKTNIDWISIPAGYFIMGTDLDDPDYPESYAFKPQHTVYLDRYYISKTPVTNLQYKAFIDAGGYSNSTFWCSDGWLWKTNNNITEPLGWSSGTYNNGISYPNYPVVGVCWYEGDAYCRWAGGKLPTEAQWEKAARSEDGRFWPWGNVWDASKCNSQYNTFPDTFTYSSPVGYFGYNISPYGVFDMTGNVWESCNDWWDVNYYSISPIYNPTGPDTGSFRVARGGSWYCVTRVTYRDGNMPYSRTNGISDIGFRIVK